MPASGCPEDRAPSVSRLSCKVTGNYYPGEHTGPGVLGVEFDILGATTFGASMQKSEYLAGAG
jgi:hypothetical protein